MARIPLRLPRVKRPANGAPAYVCPACDVLLWDGVDYETCPACDAPVDWVDPQLPVWCCRTCERMVNREVDVPPTCETCQRAMVAAFAGSPPGETGISMRRGIERVFSHPAGVAVLWILMLLPVASLALHPVYRWLALGFAPILVLPVLLGSAFVVAVVKGIPELLALARDRRTRVVHGFEHATAHLLEADQVPVIGGQTYPDGSFEIFLERGDSGSLEPRALRAAIRKAIERIAAGETALAYHPRCGSTWIALFSIAAVGSVAVGAAGLLLHVSLLSLGALLGLLLLAMAFGARPLGHLLQTHLTVDTRFKRALVLRVVRTGTGDREVVYRAELAVDLGLAGETTQEAVAARAEPAPRERPSRAPPRAKPKPPKPAPAPEPLHGIRCPSCAWVPEKKHLWKCDCGWRWSTFSTRAECPACGHRYDETQCLSCKTFSPHEAWYVAAGDDGAAGDSSAA